MRSIFAGLVMLICALLTACSKEGDQGPAGPAGAAGADGGPTVNVLYFPNPPASEWVGTGATSFSTTLIAPNITEEVLLNGYVNVHLYEITPDDTVYTLAPFTIEEPLPEVTYSYVLDIGSVTLSTAIAQGGFHLNPGIVLPGAEYGFRIAAVQ